MHRLHRPQLLGALLACTVGITAACNSQKDAAAPSAQIQSNSATQAANAPESVTGCLRAGDAPDTFVLTPPCRTMDGSRRRINSRDRAE
jgi:hypothetical protein